MTPTCWNCGYELVGLNVEDRCPECGTPVWSARPPDRVASDAQSAMAWGIVSIVLFFVCIGPFAGFVAIPAIIKSGRALAEVKAGRVPAGAAQGARAGQICGWITAALSVGLVGVYALMVLLEVIF